MSGQFYIMVECNVVCNIMKIYKNFYMKTSSNLAVLHICNLRCSF
jgi:hypothetical protein